MTPQSAIEKLQTVNHWNDCLEQLDVSGLLLRKFRTAREMQRCCIILAAEGIEPPDFGDKELDTCYCF